MFTYARSTGSEAEPFLASCLPWHDTLVFAGQNTCLLWYPKMAHHPSRLAGLCFILVLIRNEGAGKRVYSSIIFLLAYTCVEQIRLMVLMLEQYIVFSYEHLTLVGARKDPSFQFRGAMLVSMTCIGTADDDDDGKCMRQ